MYVQISASVGRDGKNHRTDVEKVQRLLNQAGASPRLDPDGHIGPKTIGAIVTFQSKFMHKPDGCVDRGGKTLQRLNSAAVPPTGMSMVDDGTGMCSMGEGPFFPFQTLTPYCWTTGWRKFASNRGGGKRAHAGCDLYYHQGTVVHAVLDGEIVRAPYYFYNNTYALEVNHGDFLIRYGEIQKDAIRVSGHVKAGEPIARVGHLSGIKVPSDMLHLEMFSNSFSGRLTVGAAQSKLAADGRPFFRRKDLIDPTPYLNRWQHNRPQ